MVRDRRAHISEIDYQSLVGSTVILNDIESFSFFFKHLSSIDCKLNVVDTWILKGGKPFRWYGTDCNTGYVTSHEDINFGSVTVKDFITLIKKVSKSPFYNKCYKDYLVLTKLCTLIYLQTDTTLSSLTVDETELEHILLDCPSDLLAIQVYYGTKNKASSGIFEHIYTKLPSAPPAAAAAAAASKSKAAATIDTSSLSHQSYELIKSTVSTVTGGADVHIYDSSVKRLILHDEAMLVKLQKLIMKLMTALCLSSKCSFDTMVLQVIFDKSNSPIIILPRGIQLSNAPYEYTLMKDTMVFEVGSSHYHMLNTKGALGILSRHRNDCASMQQTFSRPNPGPEMLINTSLKAIEDPYNAGDNSNLDSDSGSIPPISPSSTSYNKKNASTTTKTNNNSINISSSNSLIAEHFSPKDTHEHMTQLLSPTIPKTHPQLSSPVPNYRGCTSSSFVHNEGKYSHIKAVKSPSSTYKARDTLQCQRPSTADNYNTYTTTNASLPTIVGYHGLCRGGKRGTGLLKEMLNVPKNRCLGNFCGISCYYPYFESMADRSNGNTYKQIPFKSIILANAESKFTGMQDCSSFDGEIDMTLPMHIALEQFAVTRLELVAAEVRNHIRRVSIANIPQFDFKMLVYYDMFSRRVVYDGDESFKIPSSRLYETVPVCSICQKVYMLMDEMRNYIIFNDLVHRKKTVRPSTASLPTPMKQHCVSHDDSGADDSGSDADNGIDLLISDTNASIVISNNTTDIHSDNAHSNSSDDAGAAAALVAQKKEKGSALDRLERVRRKKPQHLQQQQERLRAASLRRGREIRYNTKFTFSQWIHLIDKANAKLSKSY